MTDPEIINNMRHTNIFNEAVEKESKEKKAKEERELKRSIEMIDKIYEKQEIINLRMPTINKIEFTKSLNKYMCGDILGLVWGYMGQDETNEKNRCFEMIEQMRRHQLISNGQQYR